MAREGMAAAASASARAPSATPARRARRPAAGLRRFPATLRGSAHAIHRLNERVESDPGYREHQDREQRILHEKGAAAAERGFVPREHADELRKNSQGDRQIEGDDQPQEGENEKQRPALPRFERGQAARPGHDLRGIEILAVAQHRGVAVEGDDGGEREHHEQGQRQHDQLRRAEEGLAGHQAPEAAAGPGRIGRAGELAPQAAREDRAPAVHPDQQKSQRQGFQRAGGIGGAGIGDVVPIAEHAEREGRAAGQMTDHGGQRGFPQQVNGVFQEREGAGAGLVMQTLPAERQTTKGDPGFARASCLSHLGKDGGTLYYRGSAPVCSRRVVSRMRLRRRCRTRSRRGGRRPAPWRPGAAAARPSGGPARAGHGSQTGRAQQARFVLGDAFAAEAAPALGAAAYGLASFVIPAALLDGEAAHTVSLSGMRVSAKPTRARARQTPASTWRSTTYPGRVASTAGSGRAIRFPMATPARICPT